MFDWFASFSCGGLVEWLLFDVWVEWYVVCIGYGWWFSSWLWLVRLACVLELGILCLNFGFDLCLDVILVGVTFDWCGFDLVRWGWLVLFYMVISLMLWILLFGC